MAIWGIDEGGNGRVVDGIKGLSRGRAPQPETSFFAVNGEESPIGREGNVFHGTTAGLTSLSLEAFESFLGSDQRRVSLDRGTPGFNEALVGPLAILLCEELPNLHLQ